MCAAKIFGVEILNEGSGVSIDDAVTEMQATFVARAIEPMSAVPGGTSFSPKRHLPDPLPPIRLILASGSVFALLYQPDPVVSCDSCLSTVLMVFFYD